ncbi:MAG: hypothetical protein GXP53_01220 [Deltaproteobacteria bacterium]|nr:hypothetical protein [Deltaproteobacteria bacterium]
MERQNERTTSDETATTADGNGLDNVPTTDGLVIAPLATAAAPPVFSMEEVVIKRRGGKTFSIIFRKNKKSPFDVPGIQTKATTKDILDAIRESRERFSE